MRIRKPALTILLSGKGLTLSPWQEPLEYNSLLSTSPRRIGKPPKYTVKLTDTTSPLAPPGKDVCVSILPRAAVQKPCCFPGKSEQEPESQPPKMAERKRPQSLTLRKSRALSEWTGLAKKVQTAYFPLKVTNPGAQKVR